MAGRLSEQDRKDLEKFMKFFIFKSLQIIVQSRLGEKLRSKSKVTSSGADWFSLAITDIPEVQVEARKTLSEQQPILSQTVNVEISLRTMEGASMVLELWSLSLNSEETDVDVKISSTVYNRMTMALKAIFSVSRMPPAYRLSRRQGGINPDDFVICYKFYGGRPHMGYLGDGYKTTRVGAVPTPVGTIVIILAYRTNMMMPQNQRGIPFNIKDDHFGHTSAPQTAEPRPCSLGFRHGSSSDDLRRLEGTDAQDLCCTTFSTSPPAFAVLGNICSSPQATKPLERQKDSKLKCHETNNKSEATFENLYRVGAFVQDEVKPIVRERPEEQPFAALMSGLPTPDPSNSDSSEIDSDLEDFEDLEFRKIPRPKAFDTSEELEEEASEKVEVNQAKDRSSELGVISVAEEFEKISLNRQHTYQSTGQTCASSRLLVVYMKILENYDFHPSRWLSISCLILPVDMGSVH
ncbi:autophagy-related protein 13-like isoform X2 [Pomacea canaliculata]|uniref:autophagy-related protein 13-like isoform X2 n=1 Tax=Pomacea canaliculata TaxID=400727 RepID=UPI000D72AF7B|nr:autophagy-related protein 13-like isoform X2 [Pomacea canaliculata]